MNAKMLSGSGLNNIACLIYEDVVGIDYSVIIGSGYESGILRVKVVSVAKSETQALHLTARDEENNIVKILLKGDAEIKKGEDGIYTISE